MKVVDAADDAMKDGRQIAPNFMVLGASKCGTSSLVRYLTAMPGIAFASRLGGQVCVHMKICAHMDTKRKSSFMCTHTLHKNRFEHI